MTFKKVVSVYFLVCTTYGNQESLWKSVFSFYPAGLRVELGSSGLVAITLLKQCLSFVCFLSGVGWVIFFRQHLEETQKSVCRFGSVLNGTVVKLRP